MLVVGGRSPRSRAGTPYPNPWHVLLFFVGAFVMRGAGCTWNDIVDRDLDAKVARTRSRPIPSGQVSVKAAAVFLVVQALVGLAVLLQFNRFTVLVGIASLAHRGDLSVDEARHLVAADRARSRLLVGRADGLGRGVRRLDAPALLLYAGSIAWVIGYDTIYAHQDREDDALIGVKSTARLFGARTRLALIVFYALAVLLIGLAGAAAEPGRCSRRLHPVRRASRLADRAARYRRSGPVPAAVQVEPRRRTDLVRRADRRCAVQMVFPFDLNHLPEAWPQAMILHTSSSNRPSL